MMHGRGPLHRLLSLLLPDHLLLVVCFQSLIGDGETLVVDRVVRMEAEQK